jgi:hypothetical protein
MAATFDELAPVVGVAPACALLDGLVAAGRLVPGWSARRCSAATTSASARPSSDKRHAHLGYRGHLLTGA